MKWYRYTVHTREEAEDAIIGLLYALGIESTEVSDKKPVEAAANGGLFGEVLPEIPEDDHLADISFYTKEAGSEDGAVWQNGVGISGSGVPDDRPDLAAQISGRLAALREFVDVGAGTVTRETLLDEDWAGKWKEYFHPFFVRDILVEPAWESDPDAENEAYAVIKIDPGAAFGTGTHESTRLAMEGIRDFVKPGDKVLDIGTGSGILGILALQCGASHVTGTDIDENAVPAAKENMALNKVADGDFALAVGDIASDEALRGRIGGKSYDVIAANLIAEIIARMAPVVPQLLKENGIFIASGILTQRAALAEEACRAAGLRCIGRREMGEWTGLVFRLLSYF